MKIIKQFYDNGVLANIFWFDSNGECIRYQHFWEDGKPYSTQEAVQFLEIKLIGGFVYLSFNDGTKAKWSLSKNGILEEMVDSYSPQDRLPINSLSFD